MNSYIVFTIENSLTNFSTENINQKLESQTHKQSTAAKQSNDYEESTQRN